MSSALKLKIFKLIKIRTETSGATNSVKIGLGHAGEVKIDDDIDGLNIDTTSEQIRANQITAETLNFNFISSSGPNSNRTYTYEK